jgi:thimet oligopeptidase
MDKSRVAVILIAVVTVLAVGCSHDRPDKGAAPGETVELAEAAGESVATEQTLSPAAARYSADCEAALAAISRDLSALGAVGGERTVASVFEPFNDLTREIDTNQYHAQLWFYTHPDADVRRIAGECDKKFQGLNTDLFLSRPVFEAFSAVDVGAEDEETRFFAEKQLTQFRLNGVDKGAATRSRIKALKEEIIGLEQEFASNIAADVRGIDVDSVEDLAGLPDDWIESHPPGEDGKIRVTTQYPDYMPFMRYAQNDELRRALYLEYNNRAYPANAVVLEKLISKRAELAALLGFDNWADAMNATKMSGSAEAVREFIDRAVASSEARARADAELYLERLRRDVPDAEAVMPWQGSFIGNKLRQERFTLDAAEVRPYFEYHKVRDGIFALTGDLFGYTIRPIEAEAWHESVEVYEMWLGDRLMGTFYLDMHPRADKFNHAAMFQMNVGQRGKQLPSAALVTNFPGGDGKGYMEQSQVETFLHEFGHLIHWLTMGHQRWVRNTDPEWDFIEAPSQMLENWLFDVDTVQRFATNDAGEPIPAGLIDKTRAAEDFGQGMFVFSQMSLADLSLSLHDRDPESFALQSLVDGVNDRYRLFGKVDGVHHYTAFGHLANAPYAASYYLYMWSLVIADDMFSRFDRGGLRNRKISFDYRDEVLAQGGSRPTAVSIEAFLGRPYGFESFERRLGGPDR